MPPVQADEQPPALSSPARAGTRSPPARQKRDNVPKAAWPIVRTLRVAFPLPSGTIVFLPLAERRRPRQHLQLVEPAAMAAQNRRRSSRPATGGRPGEGNGARPARSERRFRFSSQLPSSERCDHHLSPPNTSRSNTPSAWRKQASNLLWAASATATTMLSPKPSTVSTRPRSSIGAGHGGRSKLSSSRRWNGWTGSTIAGCWSLSATSRRPKPRTLLRHDGATRHRGVTSNKCLRETRGGCTHQPHAGAAGRVWSDLTPRRMAISKTGARRHRGRRPFRFRAGSPSATCLTSPRLSTAGSTSWISSS